MPNAAKGILSGFLPPRRRGAEQKEYLPQMNADERR